MLKYNDIISKLTDEQKIRILTGVGNLAGKDLKILGIPFVKAEFLKDHGRDVYPHTTSVSRAWDPELWESIAKAKAKKMGEDGTNLAIVPGARIKVSPFRKEATEDPYLASVLSGSYMRGAAAGGLTAVASGFYVTESDTEWLDNEPNERVINEYLIAPYEKAAEFGGSTLKQIDRREIKEAYRDVCDYIHKAVESDTEFFVCDHASDENTVDFISRGIICLDASDNALSVALSRYKKLQQLFEQGKDVTSSQIEEEIVERRAISSDTVDLALDNTLDFIYKCAEKTSVAEEESESEALAKRAVLESTVLLKNEGDLLPIGRGRKIGIVGGIAFSDDEKENGGSGDDNINNVEKPEKDMAIKCVEAFEGMGYKKVRAARGYHMTDYGYMDEDAIRVCKRSDVTLLFLGAGYDAEKRITKTEKLTLPPNQLYFADKISALGKKVVAVIMSEHAPDIEFTRNFDAVVLIPTEVKDSAQALVEILCGKAVPSGRLSYTLYAGTERGMKKGRVYMRDLGIGAGPFIGYRYYDTADMNVGYPFGHGLTYTDFRYSGLKYANGKVTFTVKNIGAQKAVAVPQIYIGINDSSVIRPKKELCGFARVELAPKERRSVTVSVEIPTVYQDGEFLTEKGKYTIYVGESVSDIRLRRKIRVDGDTLKSDGEKLSHYLQTYSNILEDNYTLEANYKLMKKTVKNILFGISTLALGIGLTVFNITTNARSLFLGIVAAILAVFSILFFIIEAVERSKAHAEERKRIAEANKAHFEKAEQVAVLSTDVMFKDEFDNSKEESEAETEFREAEDGNDYSEYIDDAFTIKKAVEEFNKFAADRGYKMGRGVTESLFASFTTSRLLVADGLDSESFNTFIRLISEYFECAVSVDDASITTENSTDVFFGYDSQWDHKGRNILTALQTAANAAHKVQVAAIDGITAENVHAWLNPFMKYIRSPKRRNEILIFDEYGKNYGYNIGKNLWMAINLADGEKIDTLPEACLKCASVVRISFTQCQESDDRTAPHGFTSYQADYMVVKESGRYEVTEETWKKLDKLEKYAKEHSAYSIGNKLWLDVEKHIGMLLASGFETVDAIDATVAQRILPSITVAIKDKLDKEDKTPIQMLDFIFGEDNIRYSKDYLDGLNTLRKETVVTEDAVVETEETLAKAETADAEVETVAEAETVETEAAEAVVENKESDESAETTDSTEQDK